MHEIADFRSDTVTRPTPEMYEAMAKAPVGDDVLGDDPTIIELEALGAELMGFEASLFCPSGTQANQIAFRVHGRPGDEVIVEASAHTFANEGGALAGINGLHPRTLAGNRGMLDLELVKKNIRGHDDHHARTRIITLENTHNHAGGTVLPQDQVIALGTFARDKGIAFHLDGARIANAAVASGKSLAELCEPFDSATICLSKGLCAP
ncbi:MAG: threonine aldolase family protein, partial [Planctomycetes bacterium]|nr:threonine aldolase family protein [Planctomycetota bacterium]